MRCLQMSKNNVHLALCFDLNYMYYMLVTVLSVLDNVDSDTKICLHLVHQNLSENNLNFILKKVAKYEFVTVHFYPESDLNLPEVSAGRYGLAALYRMYLAQILPTEVKKVIYLDSDLMVLGNVSDLWNVELNTNVAAAVVNLSSKPCIEVGLQPEDYFNSGVMVMDIDKWKENNISDLAIDILNTTSYRYLDQAALNLALKDKWLKLPLFWNMESDIFAYKNAKKQHEFHGFDSIDYALSNPKIIHFTGRRKPWNYYSFHPYKKHYRELITKHFHKQDFLDQDKTLELTIKKFFEFKRRLKQWVNMP